MRTLGPLASPPASIERSSTALLGGNTPLSNPFHTTTNDSSVSATASGLRAA
jgi:hypothetical protein